MNTAFYKQKKAQSEIRFGDIPTSCARYSLGRASLLREAAEANAILRIGKRVLINFNALDRYFDNLCGD